MFWIVILSILAQGFFMYKGIENVPFFLYNMFSTKHELSNSYRINVIKIDNAYYDHTQLSNREYEMLIGSLENYSKLKRSGVDPITESINKRVGSFGKKVTDYFTNHLVNDSSTLQNYRPWWSNYFSKVTGIHYKTASVVSIQVIYENGSLKRLSGDSLLFIINVLQGD